MDVTITHEEEEFYVKNSRLTINELISEGNFDRMEEIKKKLKRLIDSTSKMHQSMRVPIGGMGGGMVEMGSSPTLSKETARASEVTARQIIEDVGLCMRMHPRLIEAEWFVRMVETTWSSLALFLQAQKADREVEAQRIYMESFVKSMIRHGPRHRDSITLMINTASTINGQGLVVMGCNILRMAYILLKHGGHKGTWFDVSSPVLAKNLREEMILRLHRVPGKDATLEPLLRDQCEAFEVAAAQKPGSEEVKSFFLLGASLLAQGKALEAEAVLEKALAMSLEQEGIQLVDNDPETLQDLGVKELVAAMKRLRVAIPLGLEKAELVQLCVEESRKALARNEMAFLIMDGLGRSMLAQRNDQPEKLPRAASLHRQVLAAKMIHPEYDATEDNGTLTTMDDLKDVLSSQFKFVEALSIGEKTLSIRKRLYRDVSHPAFQANMQRQKEDLQNQKLFRANAEKILGPRSAWEGDEDGEPASVMFKRTVQEAHQKRSSSANRSSSMAGRTFQPIEFDPTDEADVNYAVLMAGNGVAGIKTTECMSGGQRAASYQFDRLVCPSENEECKKCWATVVQYVASSMVSSLPNGPPDSAAGKKKMELFQVLSMGGFLRKEILEALKKASENQEAMKQKEEEASREGGSQSGQIPPTKPIKICCGCGSYGAKKRCSQCMQVYACSEACFNAAWDAYHKHACKRQDRN